ncbi:MAG: hypothetical protein PUK08_04720 [Campylobacter lanienae]|nr:hypothetical protein [Campylobacter lanienae]
MVVLWRKFEILKWGTPRSGALGGSRECNSLSQRSALLTCEVKIKALIFSILAIRIFVAKKEKSTDYGNYYAYNY